jgi:hypothetical protein
MIMVLSVSNTTLPSIFSTLLIFNLHGILVTIANRP